MPRVSVLGMDIGLGGVLGLVGVDIGLGGVLGLVGVGIGLWGVLGLIGIQGVHLDSSPRELAEGSRR